MKNAESNRGGKFHFGQLRIFYIAIPVALVFCLHAWAQVPAAFDLVDPSDPKGHSLPPGVPRTVNTNGNVIGIDESFTTRQYRAAAIHAIAEEATKVAQALQLRETLPVTESNLTGAFIAPFGYNYINKSIGRISTSNYVYFVARKYKFNSVVVAQYDKCCLDLAKTRLPKSEIAYSAAGQVATQWLASVSVDVNRLQSECRMHVALSPHWNGVAHLGEEPSKDFVPIYYVWWTSSQNEGDGYGGVARVELFLPEKKLLQLSVDDPKYILREPVEIKNLNSLFPDSAPVNVFTNFPSTKGI